MFEMNNDECASIPDDCNYKDITHMDILESNDSLDAQPSLFPEEDELDDAESTSSSPLLSALLKADPTLAADVKSRAEADETKRIEKLRENGALGGCPRIVRKDLARQYFDTECVDEGRCILRHYGSEWYLYKDGCYARTPEEDIEKKVTGWLIRSEAADVTKSIVKDVLVNLKSDELCGLTSDYTMPCFLSTGKSAEGFVSMRNGIINIDAIEAALRSGVLPPPPLAHTPDLFTTFRLPYDYDPAATCPKFIDYLKGVQPKAENREILQMLAGLLLTPDTSFNVGFFLWGPPGTGKSVYLSILIGLVGEENTCCVPLGDFGSRFGTWPLTTALLNAVGDMPAMPESGWSANVEGCFKDVTDGRLVKVERKNENVYMAKVTARNVFATNELPYFADRSGAVRDRLRVIPFKQRFRDTAQQDLHLTEKLLEERPGIFNWAIQGLVKPRASSDSSEKKVFPHCEEGCQSVTAHMEKCDHETTYLREETEAAAPDKYLGALLLYKLYSSWAKDRGYYPVGYDKFRDAVLREYPDADFKRKNIGGGHKETVIYGVNWLQ